MNLLEPHSGLVIQLLMENLCKFIFHKINSRLKSINFHPPIIRIRHQNSVENIFIPDVFFNPSRLRQPPFFDQMLTTLLNQPMQGVDESVTRGLSNFLFKGDAPFGLDLISLNIQRGRDWALRPYNDYLSAIGFQKVRNFEHYGPIVS